jgi:hypothetical protein
LRRTLPSLDDASGASLEIEDSEELVRLALEQLDRSGLLVRALPVGGEPITRRRMIAVSATLLPAVASILAPAPAMAQLTPGAPLLSAVIPLSGNQGTTVAVSLTGSGFLFPPTTVSVSGAGVTVTDVVVLSATTITANFVISPQALPGLRSVTVSTLFGTSGAQSFTVNAPTPTAPFTVSVTLAYRHLGPGNSIVCVDTVTTPAQPDVDFTLTFTGPSTNVTRNPGLANGRDPEIFNISSFGIYTATASVTVQGQTATGSGTVNVTEAQGTCPPGYEDT